MNDMFYAHDRKEQQTPFTEMNTRWPERASDDEASDLMARYLRKRGLSLVLAEFNGWYPSQDCGDDYLRIVIPATSSYAGHAYWQARAIDPSAYIRYQSPRGPRLDAFVLLECDKRLDQTETAKTAVIVEGPMDALAVAAVGGIDAYAIMGATPGPRVLMHLNLVLKQKGYEFIFVIPDRDAVREGTAVALDLAAYGNPANIIQLSRWTEAKDLAELPLIKRRTIIIEELAAWLSRREAKLKRSVLQNR